MKNRSVVILSGGTGGAMLAAGFCDILPAGSLTVVANTGDDIEVGALYISPDPDLVTYRLAGVIDEARGWGIAGETFAVQDALEGIGFPLAWFRLGDRDLAVQIRRAEALDRGLTPSAAQAEIARSLGVDADILPMSDDPVRTWIEVDGKSLSFQEYMIGGKARPAPDGVDFRGAASARPTPSVLGAIASADAVVIGPSNPVASIGPILAVSGMSRALADSPASVVAVSPLVGGRALKGPTEVFLRAAGKSVDHAGVADIYGDLLDGMVVDESGRRPADIPCLTTNTVMDGPARRQQLATDTLAFAIQLRCEASGAKQSSPVNR